MFALARILLDSPTQWDEQMGDPVTNTGGAPVPAIRAALRHAVSVPTFTTPVAEDTVARRLRARRQLRAMLNNTPYKMAGLFLFWEEDEENSGWYIPDQGQLSAPAPAPLATGWFELSQFVWYKLGAPRTHRYGASIYAKNTREGLWPRDTLRTVYVKDFETLGALTQLSYLHAGATDVINAVSIEPISTRTLPTGRDGGANLVVTGLVDMAVVGFDMPVASRNLGDVLIYDQRGLAKQIPESLGGTNLTSDPNFERDTVGVIPATWSASAFSLVTGATVTVQTIQPFAGTKNMEVACTAAAANQGGCTACPGVVFRSGQQYSVAVWLRGNAGGEKFQLVLGNTADDSAITNVTLTNKYERYTATWTPSAARSGSNHGLAIRTEAAALQTCWVDNVMISEGPPATYADGDTAGWTWVGTPGGSASVIEPQFYGWEEVYGPDYPLTSTVVPVLDNGLIRVVYDTSTAYPGFRVFTWSGVEWVLQGRLIAGQGLVANPVLQVPTVREYSPERAVLQCVLSHGTERGTILLTLQRGWRGPRIEAVVPGTIAEGAATTVAWVWNSLGENTSVAKIDTGGAVIAATAGSGSTHYAAAALGAETFTGDNELMTLVQGGSMALGLAVVTAKLRTATSFNEALSAGGNVLSVEPKAAEAEANYTSLHLSFATQQADQIMEAENMTLGTGTASTADATASAGNAATATRTTDANAHTTRATWPNGSSGTYRVLARVRVSVNTITGSFYAKTNARTGATKTTTSATYVWLDLGDLPAEGTLEIHAWLSAAGTVYVDRIEAFLTEDRGLSPQGLYVGGRDLGQAVLFDSRVTPTVVTRT